MNAYVVLILKKLRLQKAVIQLLELQWLHNSTTCYCLTQNGKIYTELCPSLLGRNFRVLVPSPFLKTLLLEGVRLLSDEEPI